MKFPSHEWLKTCSLIKYNDNHSPIRLYTNLCPFYWTQTFIRWFHRTFATDVDADRKRLLLRTPGLAYIYVLLVTSDTLHGRRNRGWGGQGGLTPPLFRDVKKINGENALEWCKLSVQFEFFWKIFRLTSLAFLIIKQQFKSQYY